MSDLGVVVIGRNEGERLRRCFASIPASVPREALVYVDSGSTDGSVALAHSLGLLVVKLDMSTPFTAGRARNEGFNHLISRHPDLRFVQFIDGDCELCEGWLEAATACFGQYPRCGIAAGRTIEKYPEKSIYNLLCDLEWREAPFGRVATCGGIFMIRQGLFMQLGGFNPQVTAGEEPELCYRLRKQGWEVRRLDYPMVLHDAAMTRFSQWWKRAVRGGYSYAQGCTVDEKTRTRFCFMYSLRLWIWGLVLPGIILSLVLLLGPQWLWLFAVYPLQLARVALKANQRFGRWRHSLTYAIFNTIGKWPQLYGQMKFWVGKAFRKPSSLIEYK
ncbi:glycosyltransferase family 2 protein [Desulfurivibrio alkaliphilus]|uniref:Glycosyl transferase family 2 n=1 Tax=Desulfurivibrio alkaliphilus (strain DSM 19089 / UNIQEM U267 / AHT2) TaxID=589865 RepID=D6Z4I0_DESAT|nr:glycosyltransferase [Desulfurivibrio alkaliphilus]ADH86455.1 glycosyl transferase family 2 [Desulfurivibrio alkaliphilus AHT 2]